MTDMKDLDLDLGLDPATQAASFDVSKTLPCLGCGLPHADTETHWSEFMFFEDGTSCLDPRWRCGPCFETWENSPERQAEREAEAQLFEAEKATTH
jgi:hypothetical protein